MQGIEVLCLKSKPILLHQAWVPLQVQNDDKPKQCHLSCQKTAGGGLHFEFVASHVLGHYRLTGVYSLFLAYIAYFWLARHGLNWELGAGIMT